MHALQHVGVLPVPDHVSWVFSATQPLTGLFGGLGYVALFGLIAAGLAGRGPNVGRSRPRSARSGNGPCRRTWPSR